MTILVGMVGSDGIVLAADQLTVRPPQNEGQFDDRFETCKITPIKKHKVVYATAGDDVSKKAGTNLSSALDDWFDFENISGSLEAIGLSTLEAEQASQDHFDSIHRDVLIVFYGEKLPVLQIWRLHLTPPFVFTERIPGMTICGAIGNSARFFDYYYRDHTDRYGLPPIDKLIVLASHTVLMAGRIDPLMIRGLDVARFDTEGFRMLTEDEKVSLRKKSQELHRSLKNHFFGD